MRWGLWSGGLDENYPYAGNVINKSDALGFFAPFTYAVAWHETIWGEMNGFWNAATVISDGPPAGYGIFQLTVPPVGYQGNWPIDNWQDPDTNTEFALVNYLIPDMRIWVSKFGLTGDSLVKCTAASFNAGLSAAEDGHEQGNVDLYDTDAYGMTVLKIYKQIAATGNPGTLN